MEKIFLITTTLKVKNLLGDRGVGAAHHPQHWASVVEPVARLLP